VYSVEYLFFRYLIKFESMYICRCRGQEWPVVLTPNWEEINSVCHRLPRYVSTNDLVVEETTQRMRGLELGNYAFRLHGSIELESGFSAYLTKRPLLNET